MYVCMHACIICIYLQAVHILGNVSMSLTGETGGCSQGKDRAHDGAKDAAPGSGSARAYPRATGCKKEMAELLKDLNFNRAFGPVC